MNQERLMTVLVAPIVSEKATMVAEKNGQVAFRVLQGATKDEIRAAVELLFKVEVDSVQVLNQKGSLFATRPTLFTFLADRTRLEKMAKDLFKVVADGTVKIPITGRYKLADAEQAHRDLQGRETTGMVILTP